MKVKELIQACKNIIGKPHQMWDEISTNPKSIKHLYFRFLLPLLFSLPIASLLGNFIFNPLFRKPIGDLLLQSITEILILFFNIYLLSILTTKLTKLFDGKGSNGNIHRLIVYSSTAYILATTAASMFENYHSFIIVCQLMGIYSIYLINTGLPKMIIMPTDKRIPFVATIVLTAVLSNLGIRYLISKILHT